MRAGAEVSGRTWDGPGKGVSSKQRGQGQRRERGRLESKAVQPSNSPLPRTQGHAYLAYTEHGTYLAIRVAFAIQLSVLV